MQVTIFMCQNVNTCLNTDEIGSAYLKFSLRDNNVSESELRVNFKSQE